MVNNLPEEGELIGTISHYYGNIGVAVVELSGNLKVGETIRIAGGEADFTQEVESLEVDHQKVSEAKPGSSVGFKVSQKARDGYRVYRLD